jgi:lysophospholipase L1-like esterase
MDIEPRLLEAVRILRSRSDCPILIAEHAGNTGEIASKAKEAYRQANAQVRSAYETLKKRGEPEIYYLSHDELGMPMDGMIEGVHPNDYGMRFLASAFEKKIMEVWRTSKTMKTTN